MIFSTYEINNFRAGHVPPTHITTSIASFPLIMFRGYEPATFLIEEMFSKFEFYGVEKVVLRGGVSANPLYIPKRYGGNCSTYIAGCKDKGGDEFLTAVKHYYAWLTEWVKQHKQLITAIEIINEAFWKSKEEMLELVPDSSLFSCPLFASEPAVLFSVSNCIRIQSKNIHPCYQLHKTWSSALPERLPDLFAIGEDYCYNEEVKQAFYHAHA